ncbi:MAG: aminotransferase class III-fold pyridoxal phosphate-dependent enzyme, partial [Gemmatimonadaceae bacterium]
MSVLTTLPPDVAVHEIAAVLRDEYGLTGSLTPLNSERDQNFRLVDEGGKRWVVKIANADEDVATLALQAALMLHVAAIDPSVAIPRLRPTNVGANLASCKFASGKRHYVRVVEWLDGELLASGARSPARLVALGNALGRLAVALRGFAHPGAIRDFDWDVAQTSHARDRLSFVDDTAHRELVAAFLDHFDGKVAPALRRCRSQVIHGDANDHNVLVRESDNACSVALIDFGDAVHSAVVNEVAVACAYAMLGSTHSIADAARILSAFHAVHTLESDEVDLVFDLIAARLVISVCMSASRRERSGDNAYLSVSEAPAWELLERMRTMDSDIVRGIFRNACGLEAAPGAHATLAWISANRRALAPVLDVSVSRLTKALVPFSDPQHPITLAAAARKPNEAERLWNEFAMREGIELGIGPYGEERAVYTADGFASKLARGERRSVHLGLDLFRPAGTRVRTPLAGVVVDVYKTDLPLDYGHAVLLEHTPAPGVRFWTLWGHLAASTLGDRHVGDQLAAGDVVSMLGASHENGGWQPHLHLQIVTYRPASAGDVIGVGEPAQRDLWSALFPDASALAGLPPETLRHQGRTALEILHERKRALIRNLSISYRKPLKIVRGEGVTLFDDTGRAFLDCYNNVAHVGHAHPEVVEALARQASLLNTNTRYLHDAIVEYASALTATLPPSLTVAAFVCSGSEANDLALRLARHARGVQGVIALDGAYHGHSASLIDVSPYKYKRKGGSGRPATTGEALLPDPYRPPPEWPPNEIAARYAASVAGAGQQLAHGGHKAAAFIAEALPSTAGQIVLPEGYLARAYAAARSLGALVIADEVQVGFG